MKHVVVICLFAFSILPMLNIPLSEKAESSLEIVESQSLAILEEENKSIQKNDAVGLSSELVKIMQKLEIKELEITSKLIVELCDQSEIRKFLGT